ncbi:hypothetical protein MBLNU230_g6185t1 [Neophaeotheca triangularis]
MPFSLTDSFRNLRMSAHHGSGNPNTDPLSLPDPSAELSNYSLSTRTIHGDDAINSATDVAPSLHTSTTFRYPSDPDKLNPVSDNETPSRPPGTPAPSDSHIYSRLTAPNSSRLEYLLTSLLSSPALTYTSGLAAFHALLVHYHPRVVAIGAGYHGCHGVLKLYQKLTHCRIVDLFDESAWDEASLGRADLVHLETPVNPTGKAYDIAYFAQKAHARGAILSVDATFAPPPLQDPFQQGADVVMHSGTKYFGGHSDMLCGVLAVGKSKQGWEQDYWGLFNDRVFLGSVMGSLEGWLGVRSLRTFELRIRRQSENATRLVAWLNAALTREMRGLETFSQPVKDVVDKIEHCSLQPEADQRDSWLRKQMPGGYTPVFAITMKSKQAAKRLPSKLGLFHHATSLGGVESLIEWRRMSDDTVEETLLRVSVGVESWEDLRDDLVGGFAALVEEGWTGRFERV